MSKFILITSIIFSLLMIGLVADNAIYRKISTFEFDAFDMEDTKEINRLRRKDNLPLLRYNVDLIDFAQKEADRIANLSRFDEIKFNLTDLNNLFVYSIKYTGQLLIDSSNFFKLNLNYNFSAS